MSKKIKYYKNINLEEFLDEDTIIIKNEDNNSSDEVEIIEDIEDFFTDIDISIEKTSKNTVLRISLELVVNEEIIKFDVDINETTFLQLYKEFKN